MYKTYDIEWNDEKVQRFWNNKTTTNADYFAKAVGRHVLKTINKKVPLNSLKVLDYGSGPGHLFEYTKKYNMLYNALDFSPESVKHVQTNFSSDPLFEKAYLNSEIPSIKTQHDMIISCEVIEHLDDEKLEAMINDIHHLLKPKGYICFTTPNKENLSKNISCCPECGCKFHGMQHVRSWDRNNLTEFMEKSGFETVKVEELKLLPSDATILQAKEKFKNIASYFGYNRYSPNLLYIGRKVQ